MHPIGNITHPEPLITEKVNFFANYYRFVVNQMGKNSIFEIETLLSLTEKIIFQLELNDPKNVIQYLKCHLDNPILCENKYFEKCSHFDKISAHVSELKNVCELKKTVQVTFIKEKKSLLLSDFKKFRTYLRKTEFRGAFKEVVSYLKCVHELDYHKEDIKFQTRIIAATLFYARNGKADITDVITRIMSRNINEFPFPPKLLEKHKNNSIKAREEFMAKRTFDEQFGGIVNFKEKREKIKFFVFRIGNLKLRDLLDIRLTDIELYNLNHPEILKVKELCSDKMNYAQFVCEEFGVYAIVKHETIQEKQPEFQALRKLQGWVDEINIALGSNAYIDKRSFLFTRDFKHFGGQMTLGNDTSKVVSEAKIKSIESFGMFGKLIHLRSKAKKQFLLHESLIHEAKRQQDIPKYWQYLENMLTTPLKDQVVDIASNKLMEIDKFYLEDYLERCFDLFEYSPESAGFTIAQARVIQKKIKSSKIDLIKLKNDTPNPFIHELIDLILEKRRVEPESYIRRILTEIYEYRNFKVHAGLSNHHSNLKLLASVNSIMIPLRNVLLTTMKENPKLNFTEVIEYHTKKDVIISSVKVK